MHYHVGKFDASLFAEPAPYAGRCEGFERVNLIDREAGSVHAEACISRLAPGGHVEACVHAFEKGIYVFEGEIEVLRDDECLRLSAEGYVLIPYATSHAIRNRGTRPARWFELLAPQPKHSGAFVDTFFTDNPAWPSAVADPARGPVKGAGLFKPENPNPQQAPALQQGLTVYRFMERNFGATCFFMMRGEMSVGAYRTRHDHPIEEFYLGLSGEVMMDIEDETFRLGPGDFAWTGVGASHAFRQVGDEPFRWLETQAPQFPAQHGTRNYVEWEKLRAGGIDKGHTR
jgi:mannose-6-phosphate isomerase-like protein (cupin superfamily)